MTIQEAAEAIDRFLKQVTSDPNDGMIVLGLVHANLYLENALEPTKEQYTEVMIDNAACSYDVMLNARQRAEEKETRQ